MNKSFLIKLSTVVFVSNLMVMPVGASIINDAARFLKVEMDKAEKRDKFCSAPIYRNIPVLTQAHKAVSNFVGVKSLYKTINDLPATIADGITDIKIVNEGIKIALKTPLRLFLTDHLSAQGIMRAGVEAITDKTVKALPESVATYLKDESKVPKIVKGIAMDVAMGDRPGIASIVYNSFVKSQLLKHDSTKWVVNTKIGGEAFGVHLYNGYAKAVFCKLCQPLEDALYRRVVETIKKAADDK